MAYVEFREQTGYPMIFLPLSCLPSHQAKWTLISSRMISICSWCALAPICPLLASTQCFLEHPSPSFLILDQLDLSGISVMSTSAKLYLAGSLQNCKEEYVVITGAQETTPVC